MSYVSRTTDVRHDGLDTSTRSMTTTDGVQRYVGEGIDNHPDGTFTVHGPGVVAGDTPGTFRVQN